MNPPDAAGGGTGPLLDVLAGRGSDTWSWTADEWDRLAQLAERFDVAPLVHQRLKEHSVVPPGHAGARLRGSYLACASRNVRLFHGLARALAALASEGIPAVPLKGACLAESVYGDIALRPMSDLDLLVAPANLTRAVGALESAGFAAGRNFDPAAERQVGHHMPVMTNRWGSPVELHWTLMDPGIECSFTESELEQVWARSLPATVADAPARMLCATDLVLHLCIHASSHHRFSGVGLRAIVDIAEVIRVRGEAIDWDSLADRARRWSVQNGISVALQLARDLGGACLPPGGLAALNADPVDDEIVDWARSKVLTGSPLPLDGEIVRFAGEHAFAGQAGTLSRVLFPPRLVMARMYPARADSWRLFACYPLRLKELWARHRHALWKVATRDMAFVADARKEVRLRQYLGWK